MKASVKLLLTMTGSIAPPPAPANLAITGASGGIVADLTPTVTFTAAPGATSHKLQWSTDSGFSTVTGETTITMPTAEYTHTVALAAYTRYHWRVAGINAGGQGPWSDTLTVIVVIVAGMNVWFDANDASTLWQDTGATTPAASNGDSVALWQDKSGNGYHVAKNGAANVPTLAAAAVNGHNVLNFQSTSAQYLKKTSYALNASRLYIFAVIAYDVPTGYNGLVCTNDGSNNDFDGINAFAFVASSNNRSPFFVYRQGAGAADIGLTGTTVHGQGVTSLITVALNTTAGTLRANGTQEATDNPYTAFTMAPTVLVIGGRALGASGHTATHDGYIAEILIYTSALTAQNITDIEAYLMTKWGIS